MKKLTVIMLALVAVFAVSCKKSAKDAQIELVKETIAKFEKATTMEELEAIMPEFQAKAEELSKNYTEEENTTTFPEVAELMTKMEEAAKAAEERISPAAAESEEVAEGEAPAEDEESAEESEEVAEGEAPAEDEESAEESEATEGEEAATE